MIFSYPASKKIYKTNRIFDCEIVGFLSKLPRICNNQRIRSDICRIFYFFYQCFTNTCFPSSLLTTYKNYLHCDILTYKLKSRQKKRFYSGFELTIFEAVILALLNMFNPFLAIFSLIINGGKNLTTLS